MLILTRKKEESIILDDKIEVKVLAVEGGRVKLGIEAPADIEIHRQEVYEEIKAENQEAAKQKVDLEFLKGIKSSVSGECEKDLKE
ncbi:carbon storage regulator CsrA [Natroniella sulfidigena]|uniref:carbon storage regulator CsrA n=1 Tax=Natroniella sulfidigena TaxID=723921 RepID=UPI00200B1B1B|nr:carbon storage regulator CsrA [Natroniella sulfidigena]MCK8816028.1 carbon storage regulator CsrA [Natroniella sulfidigena]